MDPSRGTCNDRLKTTKYSRTEHNRTSITKQKSYNYRNKDPSREEQRKRNQQVGKEKKIMYVGNLYETVTENGFGKFFGLRTKPI